jgi:hypothetical protein
MEYVDETVRVRARYLEERRRNATMDKMSDKGGKPLTKDEKLDEALEDSFPASDPPSMTDPHRSTVKKKPKMPEIDAPKDQKTAD